MMEQARVVIIGAGPAGLVLALSLAQHHQKSIILEREPEITSDPRGVYLAGDAVRILHNLGLGPQMPIIGEKVIDMNFHTSSFQNPPFHHMDISRDALLQTVPGGILQVQPELENALRNRVNASEYCDLRVGCDVLNIRENDAGIEIQYNAPDRSSKSLQTVWLIGADGKKGVVRKTFLEPVADIRQIESQYRYEGTWIATNLKMTLPTAETHPELPFWSLGMTPEDVYDLFWPKGWHFCSPPGKPTASGRFGPHSRRLWRHELRQDDWNDSMDAEKLFWEHLDPMITRTSDLKGNSFGTAVIYPKDCIEILRCRPFQFSHKVVNRWFHRRSVLIGDAAHIYPPFGGQGIATGIRDAHQLAWRIAMLEKDSASSFAQSNKLLEAWEAERLQSVKDSAEFTRINGMLCNQPKPLIFPLLQVADRVLQTVSSSLTLFPDPQGGPEQRGFSHVRTGFSLPEHGGGRKLPQIPVDDGTEEQILSDEIFTPDDTPLRLIIFPRAHEDDLDTEVKSLQSLLRDAKIPQEHLSPKSIVALTTRARDSMKGQRCYFVPDLSTFESRLGKETRYAVARPDHYVFATARDVDELRTCLQGLADLLGATTQRPRSSL